MIHTSFKNTFKIHITFISNGYIIHCRIIYLKFILKCHNPNNTAELKTPTGSNGDLFGSQMT